MVLTCADCDFSVHLVATDNDQLELVQLPVRVHADDGSLDDRDPIRLSSLSTLRRLDERLVEVFESSENLLVTAELEEAELTAYVPVIEELFARRRPELADKTVFVAGGLAREEVGQGLMDRLGARGVDCRRTVARRVCYVREQSAELVTADAGGDATESPSLHVDSRAEWVIEGEPDCPVLATLAPIDHMTFATSIGAYEDRCRWLHEGPELALALWARRDRQLVLGAAARHAKGRVWAGHYFVPMLELLRLDHPCLTRSSEYAYEQLDVWARHDRDVNEVLRLLRRSDPMPLFEQVERLLVEPLERLRADGLADWERLSSAFWILSLLMKDMSNYGDYSELVSGKATLTKLADDAAVARYKELAERVFPSLLGASLASSIGHAFVNHRRLFN